jgi:hypothetical protein
MSALRHYRRLLRTAFLALLVLGLVVNPTLAAVGELHAIEHAAAASGHDRDGHPHSAGTDDHHHDHPSGHPDRDHATGTHGLMHQSGTASFTLPEAEVVVSGLAACGPLLPEFRRCPLPGDCPNLPFRPPIA